ncbi:hypothetical protein [Tessaracoccus antarcticus]|uniref:DUF4352 domain-containing protein n=1 Tax=Tessaracoccus antarcticus TaxID=2479848 RepID=A0A3M0GA56_9ACTN|nr:hypothetical protein [Tessaracoccus antarcticus]RMB61840.1 hypothetical protein EAX62_04335 [Tessaracoccus antarcticus]
MNRRVAGVVAVVVSLVVVGVVRSAIPPYLPTQSHVSPDEQSVVDLEVGAIQLLEVRAATRLQGDGSFPDGLGTDATFVTARVRITPHGGTLRVVSDIQSADGRSYEALDVAGLPSPAVVYVGQRVTQTLIFEVPADRLAGAHLVIRGAGDDGVQAIQPVAWFPVEVDVESGSLTIDETIVEPAA